MFLARLKNLIGALVAFAVGVVALFFVWGTGATRFPDLQGERTYYLRSASSQALIKTRLTPLDFPLVRGESVRFSCDEAGLAERILANYEAELLFTEEVDGRLSYYAYSKKLQGGLQVGAYFVNLHIAMKNSVCTVGSPIIFGGF